MNTRISRLVVGSGSCGGVCLGRSIGGVGMGTVVVIVSRAKRRVFSPTLGLPVSVTMAIVTCAAGGARVVVVALSMEIGRCG